MPLIYLKTSIPGSGEVVGIPPMSLFILVSSSSKSFSSYLISITALQIALSGEITSSSSKLSSSISLGCSATIVGSEDGGSVAFVVSVVVCVSVG